MLYYCGPTFKKKVIGACGPTTSSRMDPFVEPLLKCGVRATIGKGARSARVVALCKKYKSVYFITHAGCAAYLSQFVRSYRVVAFPDLGAEAMCELQVAEFPLIVGVDSYGKDLYDRL